MSKDCCIKQKKTTSGKYLVKGMNTYAMYLINVPSWDNSVFALSKWCIDVGEKSKLKQFNIKQQHNKMWKKLRGMNTFTRHSIYIYINIYVCVCVCGHVYVVYEDTNLYNDMGMT